MMYKFDNGRLAWFFDEDTMDFTISVMARKVFNRSYVSDDGWVVFIRESKFRVMLNGRKVTRWSNLVETITQSVIGVPFPI